jgi:hypothetical protein
MTEIDPRVRDAAIEVSQISVTGMQQISLTRKFDLLKVSGTVRKPIFHYKNEYFILDPPVCYYFEEK